MCLLCNGKGTIRRRRASRSAARAAWTDPGVEPMSDAELNAWPGTPED